MDSVKIILPQLHQGQQTVKDSTARFKILQCGRRWGKSALAQSLCIEKMLEGKRCVYMPHKFFLARKFFLEFLKVIPEAIIKSCNKSDLFLELSTGGSIQFLSGEAPGSARGLEFEYCVCDEAAHIPGFLDIWEGEILPTLAITEGEGLIISTPRGMGGYHVLYLKGLDGMDQEYKSFHYPSSTNPYFPSAEFEKRRKTTAPEKFAEEYLAIPGQNQASAFGIDNIQKNIIKEISKEPTVVYGIDVSTGLGSDYTVVIGLDSNGAMTYYDKWKLPFFLTKEKLMQLPSSIPKFQDCSGIGAGLADQLQMEMENYYGFLFTTQSKTRIITDLISAVTQGTIKYTEPVANEMAVYEFKRNPNTNHTSYNAQTGFNDDCVCALAIALHHKDLAVSNSTWKLYSC